MGVERIPIELDKPRSLFYKPSDAMDAEAQLGGESIEESIGRRGYRRLVVWLWAGLKGEDRRLTIQDTAKLLDQAVTKGTQHYSDYWNMVAEAMRASNLLRSDDEGVSPPPLPPVPIRDISRD